ncbi:MAG: hypothetical protein WBL21_13280 [Salinimicrobium sp.]
MVSILFKFLGSCGDIAKIKQHQQRKWKDTLKHLEKITSFRIFQSCGPTASEAIAIKSRLVLNHLVSAPKKQRAIMLMVNIRWFSLWLYNS